MGLKMKTLFISLLLPIMATAAVKKQSSKVTMPIAEETSLWGFNYYTEQARNAEKSADDFVSTNVLTTSYKLDPNMSLAFLFPFEFTWNQNDSLKQGDIAFQFANKIGTLPGGVDFGTKYRLYLPTSAASEDLGRYQLRVHGILSGNINPSVSYRLETNPRFYGYTKTEEGQLALKWINTAALNFKAGDVFSFDSELSYIHKNSNSGIRYESDKELFQLMDPYDYDDGMYLYLAANFTFGPTTFSLAVDQETDLRNPEPTQLFKGSETTYYVIMNIAI